MDSRVLDVIIDTDPGIDDAMAILLMLSQPSYRVIGLTITHGNLGGREGMEKLVKNASRVLRLARRYDVPIVVGEQATLLGEEHEGAPFVHGEDGMGDVSVMEGEVDDETSRSRSPPVVRDQRASDWIVSQVMQRPEDTVVLVTLGPLTNIACALRKCPQMAPRVHAVHTMGGCFFVPGNITCNGEANIVNDPEAANEVFSAEFRQIFLSPLDVTTRTHIDGHFTERLRQAAPRVGSFIHEILKFYLNFHKTCNARDMCDVHDSTAVASLIWPDLFTDNRLVWVRVNCPKKEKKEDALCRGVCVADFRKQSRQNAESFKRNTTVRMCVQSEEFLRRYIEAIKTLE